MQDEKERFYNSDQKRTDGKKEKRERPPSVVCAHQADMALLWRKRPGSDGPWRAGAGLTNGGLGRKSLGPDPALIARDGEVA